jgi:hypothetical protein
MGGLRRRLRLSATFALVFAGLCATGCSGSNDGVTSTQPSDAQLTAMSTYFIDHFAGPMNSSVHEGCVAYSIGTRPESGGQVISYAQIICEQCPERSAEEVPAVFVLHGESVISGKADTEPGDPMFADQINRMFPPSLQSAAKEQQMPNAQTLTGRAAALGGC